MKTVTRMVIWMNGHSTEQRVFEIVRDLNLGRTGVALDFGCWNGVTEVLRQALPEWVIYGCDISE